MSLSQASRDCPRCPQCGGPSIATSDRRRLARPMLICAPKGHVWAASDAEYMRAKAADQAFAQLQHGERMRERRARG